MTMAARLTRNFVPPIFFKGGRIADRLMASLLPALNGRSLADLRYASLGAEVQSTPEIETLFPAAAMAELWGYARLENRPGDPNLFVHQIRMYRVVQFLRRAFPDVFSPGARVLDVGDTSGILLRALGKRGLSLNLRPDRVAYLCAHGMRAAQGDARALPFEDGSFDFVICLQTLEHVKSPVEALDEMGRVARRAVFVSVPLVETTRIWGREGFLRDYRGAAPDEFAGIQDDECHVFEFSSADLVKLLSFTRLLCTANFPLAYFDGGKRRTWQERALARLTPSHFNFFVLEHRNGREGHASGAGGGPARTDSESRV